MNAHSKAAATKPTLAAKAKKIIRVLDRIHPSPAVPLDHVDPFTLLVSVVLSAQTTDKKVNQVTPALFAKGPTAQAMSSMRIPQVQRLIREVGLAPQKAKALVGLSKMLIDEFDGDVPKDLESLERLPGVGHKTAQVVMAQAFGVPSFPVDTHIHRLAYRWGLSSGKNVLQTERDLKRIFPIRRWNRLHLQMIYFGRSHCTALRHFPDACPICVWALEAGRDRPPKPAVRTKK